MPFHSLTEMYTLLQFLMPGVFDADAADFMRLFDAPFEGDCAAGASSSAADAQPQSLNEEERLLLTTRMHEALRPFMLRRVKEKVAADLPAKREVLLRCAPSGYQAHLYAILAQRAWASVAAPDAPGATKARTVSISNVLMEMVRFAMHNRA